MRLYLSYGVFLKSPAMAYLLHPISQMPRRIEFAGELEPLERKVAHLAHAGTSQTVIAYLIECSQPQVGVILKRPRVAMYLQKLAALDGLALAPALKNLEESINFEADHAFDVEKRAMDRLDTVWPDEDNPVERVHVQSALASAQIAQDILDRAGKRAPTKIQQKVEYSITPDAIDALTRIVGDVAGREIDITPEGDQGTST